MKLNMKLNQVIAIANGEKSRHHGAITSLYQDLKKTNLFEGVIKTYQPIDEEGFKYPDERKHVQVKVEQAVKDIVAITENMFNITATQDTANCIAAADIKVDGVVVAKKVPVTHILFLEKQLVDLNTFIGALPTLDPAEEWTYSSEAGCFKSSAKDTIKSNKVRKNHIKYEATKEHPAQVETYETEVPVGTWTTIKFSGNISSDRKNQLLTKVRELAKALKLAREEANGIEVEKSTIGSDILNYIFG